MTATSPEVQPLQPPGEEVWRSPSRLRVQCGLLWDLCSPLTESGQCLSLVMSAELLNCLIGIPTGMGLSQISSDVKRRIILTKQNKGVLDCTEHNLLSPEVI